MNGNNRNASYGAVYFDSFGDEHISNIIKKFAVNKNIIKNIYRIQAHNSMMCGYFCIGFIDFILTGKSLPDYTNLFFSNDYEKNEKIISKHFKWLKREKIHVALFAVSIENLKSLKYHTFLKEHKFFLFVVLNIKMKMKKYLKKKNQ